jgi:hypothetical protein
MAGRVVRGELTEARSDLRVKGLLANQNPASPLTVETPYAALSNRKPALR